MSDPSGGLSFTTAARTATSTPVTFTLDDDTFTATRPKDSILLMGILTADSLVDQLRAVVRFFDAILPEDQAARIASRLRDPDDDLDLDTLTNVYQGLIKEFTGRPTETPSDSVDGQEPTGPTSTG